MADIGIEQLWSEGDPGNKCKTVSEKQLKAKLTEGMAQVIECLPHKCDALSSNPKTAKKTKSKTSMWFSNTTQ
jgi:hypothetical protein